MKLHLDRSQCTGHGQCEVQAPDVFALDELGFSEPLVTDVPVHLVPQARAGVDACPERAIALEP
jgi:ferredoxin